ncbi:GNAT family N-acetyltransferase [Brevundimonas fluminis]|uniref:GNAT family N-acetyltransferase n=1 Tax=Brevundimonas fluminis TaxID=2487274 RepID=UPI000F656E2B|nr:GNAT family N-acetyltransferase [Brevundimonas fluminis]
MIRPFEVSDLPAALALQAVGYPTHLHDGEAAFASRPAVAPGWCWVAESAGRLDGYLLSHPWVSMRPPPPDVVLASAEGPVWYVHDLSVAAHARGAGTGRALLNACRAAIPGIRRSELIAVEGAAPYWMRADWRPVDPLPPALAAKVAGYGPLAIYMVREFD